MRRSRSYSRRNSPAKVILSIALIIALAVGVFFGVRALILGRGDGNQEPAPSPTEIAIYTPPPTQTPEPSASAEPVEPASGERDVYRMEIRVDPETNVITGAQTVLWTNRTEDSLEEVLFRLYPNALTNGADTPVADLDKVFPSGLEGAEGIQLKTVAVDGKTAQHTIDGKLKTTLRVQLEQAAEPGDSVTVQLEWSLKLNKGFYPLAYSATGIQCCWFYPMAAAYANGSWSLTDVVQTFGYDPWYYPAADYDVVIHLDSDYHLLSTGTVTEQLQSGEETVYYISERGARDFAFCVTDLEKTATVTAGESVTITARAQYNDRAQELANSARAMVEYFETLLGPCPVSELELCQATFTGTSSVHHGLILYDSALFSGRQANADIALACAVARQWLGESVGSGYADDKDLHRPLCEYLAYLYLESRESSSAETAAELAGTKLIEGIRTSIGTSRFDPALLSYCEEYAGQKGSVESFAALCGDSETDVLRALGR